MASESFDRQLAAAWEEARPVFQMAERLAPIYLFESSVDLFRFARSLHRAGLVFYAFINEFARKDEERRDFQRKLEGRPPLTPENERLVLLMIGLSSW